MQDRAIAAEGDCYICFFRERRGEGVRRLGGDGCEDWKGKGGVQGRGGGWLKQNTNGWVGGSDVSRNDSVLRKGLMMEKGGYFANSFNASVAFGAFSFWTSRTLRGGDGHWREWRSFDGVSTCFSVHVVLESGMHLGGRLTKIAWVHAIR